MSLSVFFCGASFVLVPLPGMPPDIADMPSASVAFSMMFGERPQEEVSDRGGLFYEAKCAPRRSRQVVRAPVCFQIHASRFFLSAREHWLQRGQHGSFIVCVGTCPKKWNYLTPRVCVPLLVFTIGVIRMYIYDRLGAARTRRARAVKKTTTTMKKSLTWTKVGFCTHTHPARVRHAAGPPTFSMFTSLHPCFVFVDSTLFGRFDN